MASDDPARARRPKVVGLGAPISVWIYFEPSEIPALLDALGEELAAHGCSSRIRDRDLEAAPGVDPAEWRYHAGELHRMLGDIESAREKLRPHERVAVLWTTVMAHGVVHGAVAYAERRVAEARPDDVAAAIEALEAARRTLCDFHEVDSGGLPDVSL